MKQQTFDWPCAVANAVLPVQWQPCLQLLVRLPDFRIGLWLPGLSLQRSQRPVKCRIPVEASPETIGSKHKQCRLSVSKQSQDIADTHHDFARVGRVTI